MNSHGLDRDSVAPESGRIALSPQSDTEERHGRLHRPLHGSSHRHGRSRSQSRSRHHHHHHHHHHRHHRHGQVSQDITEADRQMLRSPQTARPSPLESHADLEEDLSRGPRTAPMCEAQQSLHALPRNLLLRPGISSNTSSRTETPAPTYHTDAPFETDDSARPPTPSKSSTAPRPGMSHSQSLPLASVAKASPRTLAFVEEQRTRLQRAANVPAATATATAAIAPLDAPNRVHFVPSSAGTTASERPIPPHPAAKSSHHQPPHHHGPPKAKSHSQSREQCRDSISTMHEELNNRDQRFSHMVEDCFRDSAQYLQAFNKNTRTSAQTSDLRKRQKKQRTSMVDSIMGMDEMRPQDLVYGEGSKVDGGFGFALPSRYREGTVLLDSGPARLSIDSSVTATTETESTGSYSSYSSRLSGMFGKRGSAAQQQRQRESADSRGDSFLRRSNKPHSLADRVASANLRPPPLNIHRNLQERKPMTPSRLRESTSVSDQRDESSKAWEDVKLDTDEKSYHKNDRLAAALGVKKPERVIHRDDSDSTMVDDDSIRDDEKSISDAEEDGRYSKFNSTYSKKDQQGRRSSVGMPQGMSQADIVAICLIQGMVPPGLPPDNTLVTWSSPLSPTNPRNWSPFHKWYACILVSMATFLANAGTNMLAPALGLISVTYKEIYTPSIRGLLIGCYVLAFAFAPLIFGPMSEVMGRKPVLLIGCAFFFVFTIASGFVNSSYLMMFFRFLTALGASAPMSIGGAVITDIFPPEQRGSAMTVFALAPQLGPVLGPVMGGWVTQEIGSWRWIFYIKAIAIFVFCAPMIFIKESYTPRILAKRAVRLRKETGNASLSTIFERRKETVAQIFMRGAVRPLVLFGKEPIIQMICIYVSVIYGVIHLLVATFPAVMGTVYAEYPGWASMHFIGIGVGTITGGMAGGFLTEIHYRRLTKQNGGIARPEFKLFSLLYTTWLSPLGLAGYFFITYWGIHWIFADVFIVLFCFGISAAVVSLQSYIVDCYSLLAGSALTSTIVIRSFFGFGATVGAEDLLLRGGLFWSGVSLSTLTTVTCVPIVFIVYYYGASMRSKSRYATHKR